MGMKATSEAGIRHPQGSRLDRNSEAMGKICRQGVYLLGNPTSRAPRTMAAQVIEITMPESHAPFVWQARRKHSPALLIAALI